MRTCEDYEELISARLDGALTDEERAALDAHLAGCPRCRRTAAELARVDAALRSLDGAAPVDLTARVRERIGEERAVPLRRPRRAMWGVACAAALALALVAGRGLSLFPAAGDEACDTAPLAAEVQTIGDDEDAPTEDGAAAEPEDGAKMADTAPASAAGEDRRPARQEQRPAVHGADDGDLADDGDPAGADDGQAGEIASGAGGGAAPRAANETGEAANGTGRAAASDQTAAGPLTEDDAAAALRAWLGAEDAPLTALGTTDDGGAWRFALDGRTFAVSVEDGAVSEEGTGAS